MLDRSVRIVLVVLNLFLATNAIAGAVWVIPSLPPEWLQGTPFSSYLLPALSLAVIVGGGALMSATALLQHRWWAPVASVVTGLSIVIFEIVEATTMSLSVWLHLVGLEIGPVVSRLPLDPDGTIPFAMWLQPFFFAFGIVLIALAISLWPWHVRPIILDVAACGRGDSRGRLACPPTQATSGTCYGPVELELAATSLACGRTQR